MIEFFENKRCRKSKPSVTITRSGQMTFNRLAVKKYRIENTLYVNFGFDREKKIVALKLSSEKTFYAGKISISGHSNSNLCAKSFLKFFDISHEKAKSYPLIKGEDGMLIFYLEEKSYE